jgi:peptide/nickel transport system substrate-binding protein
MKPLKPSKPRLFDRLLSLIEVKPASDRLILRVLFFVIVFSGVFTLISINNHYSSVTPIRGGTLKEGIVGTPRFINPALAIARADQDVTALIYSGLLKVNEKGELVPDIAESITTSDDGLTYNIVLRKDVHFHDGTPLTAKDVDFTIGLIKNPDLKSPLRGNWSDVTVEVVNDYELNIVLKNPYVPFKENFLVGIMPSHLWSQIPVEQLPFNKLNTEPIGTGPFKIKTATRDANGLINGYILSANKATPTPPKIDTFELHFYNDEGTLVAAMKKGTVDGSAYVANEDIASLTESGDYKVITEPLPRVFGMFFNQNKQSALRDPAVREALEIAIDRNDIITTALKGQGVPIKTPMPESGNTLQSTDGSNEETPASRVARAQKILTDAGWSKNNLGLLEKQIDGSATTLSLTVRTSNVPLFNTVSQMVADEWKAIGVEVSTEQFEQTGLVQTVIRPRDFEVLLFGLDMSRAQDLYPFWHSSQKDDPGLNIAQYTNLSVDALLEKARTEQDENARTQALSDASTVIKNERPAIFLFEPMMTYVVKKDAVISDIHNIGKPSDRFGNITDWYTDSDNIWNIFKANN